MLPANCPLLPLLLQGSLQSTVMIPTKETKSLTYQLLESHFLHTQELRKNLASNAPSKSFHLFYVNLDQVSQEWMAGVI